MSGVFRHRFIGYRPARRVLPSIYVAPTGGTGNATAVILDGDTNGSGEIQDTTFSYTSDQPVTGRARKGTSVTRYKTAPIEGTITVTGLTVETLMSPDEG